MSVNINIPCPDFPPVSADLKVTLPFGELKAFRDFSLSLPTDCNLSFNLLLQIQPLLASMACLLKILNVIASLKEFLEAFPNIPKVAEKAGTVVTAIGDLGTCLPPGIFVSLALTIKGILQIILAFLGCLISQIESILNFQLGLDFDAAAGNPALTATLNCAKENAQLTADHLAASLGPIQPLLDMVGMIAGIVGLDIALPSMSAVFAPGADMAEGVAKLRETVAQMQQVVDSIPG